MSSAEKVLVYWIKERGRWSVVTPSAVRSNVCPGEQTQTKYQGTWYPSLVVAKGDKEEIDNAEHNFSDFIQNCLMEEAPENVNKKVVEYAKGTKSTSAVTDEKDTEGMVSNTMGKVTESLSQLQGAAIDLKGASFNSTPATKKPPTSKDENVTLAMKTISIGKEKENVTPATKTVPMDNKENVTPNQQLASNIFTGSLSEKRISKLEGDVKQLKEDVRYLRKKLRKLNEENTSKEEECSKKLRKLDEDVTEKSQEEESSTKLTKIDTVAEKSEVDETCAATINYDEKLINQMSTDKEKLKYLVSCFFSDDQLIRCSRTGKRSHKSAVSARPPFNAKHFGELTAAVTKFTSFDTKTFYAKFENLQKMLRRQ